MDLYVLIVISKEIVTNDVEDVNMSDIEQENVGILWRELQEQWKTFKDAESKQDQKLMVSTARRIQDIQDDLGLHVANFGDLEVDIRVLRNKSK